MEASIWPCQTSDKSSEVWQACELDEVTREKLSNTWQRSDRTSEGRFCDRHEVKPNRKFDSVRGLVDRNFRTVRPRFSIQFSISSPVIVRNRRIEPKFGLLNLSIREVKRIHETRRVRVRPTSLVKHSWRVEKRLSHWWRVADECDVKKMAHGRLPGSASKLHATASPPSRGRGRIRFASFSGFTVISIWWVSSKGKWKSKKTEQWSGSVPHLPNSHCHSFLLKKSTPWQNPRCPKSKFLAVERDKVLPRCPNSTLSKIRRCQKKKKSKFGGNLTRSGVRVRGLGLVWTSALTRSDRDQGQTRSRTRHRNLTRLVSHVLLTSLLTFFTRDWLLFLGLLCG